MASDPSTVAARPLLAGAPRFEPFAADALNRECFCVGADLAELHARLQEDLARHGLPRPIAETHAHLFSTLPVFVARGHIERMRAVIDAVETAVASPAYRAAALGAAAEIARFDPRTHGVFLGYDFHLGAEGPRLIEINTNAGGALLNAALGRAQRACCAQVAGLLTGPADVAGLEARLFDMFVEEWRRAGHEGMPARVAIVDDAPAEQYLYPEFLLFQRLFEAAGVRAVVADAADLAWRDGALWYGGGPVDLVYNRLTDFYLARPEHAALRAAYLAGAAVVTPHPRAHALYADKRNLALLTDAARLRDWGLAEPVIAALLAGVPRTRPVAGQDPERLWAERKRLFFKPAAGFGSRGAYRGDKLTRRAFAGVLAGDYVAQELVPPSERAFRDESGSAGALRLDVRCYVYGGEVQLYAARLYQGQTTNFRTPGGGFAPVFYPPAKKENPARAGSSAPLREGG
ncbi:MAG: hypothetical protein KJ025_20890 [Burkholderiales bacterium]|nr:hypothetical protein [Burkholderiales bacterium]